MTLPLFLHLVASKPVATSAIAITFNPLLSALTFLPTSNFSPPPPINLMGQLLLGITIGEFWGSKPNLGKKTIGYALITVTMTIRAGLIAAAIARLLTDWDWLMYILVTAPGGAPEMILVALALEHNVEIVTADHLVRLLAINGSLPLWILWFRYLDRNLSKADND